MQAPKNGFFYVLDRETGELISAKNYVHVNWASHIDFETGRPIETGIGDWSETQRMIAPSIVGGHNWNPMSYSDNSGLVYIPTIHTIYPFTPNKDYQYDPAGFNTGEDFAGLAASTPSVLPKFCSPTRLTAWDPVKQEKVWQVKFSRGISAGILSTAGGLVFQGTTDGALKAYRDIDGEELWAQRVNVGIMAPPISYIVGDDQYVAVVAGLGGSQGVHNIWPEIVLDGVFGNKGMASFKDTLNKQDVNDIHAYIVQQAIQSTTMSHKILKGVVDQICIPAEWLAE